MIPVPRAPEPAGFDERVRKRGQQWLAENPDKKEPRPYWQEFKHQLWLAFGKRCGYSAMFDPTEGSVDHFLSAATHRELAYEWSNYRLASTVLNQRKKTSRVLDPHEVSEGWFEILLPSLQLVATDKIPAEARELAQFTLKQLRLGHDEQILRQRQQWYEMYRQGKLSLDGLRDMAPLIAAAVEKHGPFPPPQALRKRTSKSHQAASLTLPGLEEDLKKPDPEPGG